MQFKEWFKLRGVHGKSGVFVPFRVEEARKPEVAVAHLVAEEKDSQEWLLSCKQLSA